jgi:hypothetical protein
MLALLPALVIVRCKYTMSACIGSGLLELICASGLYADASEIIPIEAIDSESPKAVARIFDLFIFVFLLFNLSLTIT